MEHEEQYKMAVALLMILAFCLAGCGKGDAPASRRVQTVVMPEEPHAEFARLSYAFDGARGEDALVVKLRSSREADLYARVLISARLDGGESQRIAHAFALRGSAGGRGAEVLFVSLAIPCEAWVGRELIANLQTAADDGTVTWSKQLTVDVSPATK